jgi:Fe2+ or Zn2+ uptake regulation protein
VQETDDEIYQKCIKRLSTAGYRLTSARRMVLRVICDLPGHQTSATILQKVSELDASIGRASVFRVLDLLSRLSIIRPTYVASSTPEYVLLPENGHHAHIICPGCNQVTELNSCLFDTQLQQMAQENGIQLTGHILELFGYCPACIALGFL